MHHLRLVGVFMRASAQQELAYRANFFISLLHSTLNLGTGILGIVVLFGQVQTVNGWTFPATLALLGVYLTLSALRGLFIGPSLDALAGMDGEVWAGRFDYTLLRPVNVQFMASLRQWRPLALLDLILGLAVVLVACLQLGPVVTPGHLLAFLCALAAGVTILYAILLAFVALVFWSPGFLFTWLFDSLFQMARYPVGLYPGWLRLALTWVIPVGLMTTLPAQALTGEVPFLILVGGLVFAGTAAIAASLLSCWVTTLRKRVELNTSDQATP